MRHHQQAEEAGQRTGEQPPRRVTEAAGIQAVRQVTWLGWRSVLSTPGTPPTRWAFRSLGPEAEQALLRRAWPGNVRELRNAIERACLLSETQRIEVSLLRNEGEPDDILAAPDSCAVGASMPRLEDFLRLQ